MKKFTLFLVLMFATSLVFAQVQTIHNPNAKVTVKNDQIRAWGQNSPNNPSSTIVLDFEGLGDNDGISQFYNGGTSGLGFSGTNYGVYFSDNASGLIDLDNGGTGGFANEPSPNTVMYFLTGTAIIMNVPAGFTTGFSFYYTSSNTGTVFVYDGLNGTGNLLASQPFAINYNLNCTGDPTGIYCHWDAVGVAFSGTAKSVSFMGVQNQCAFDNVTLESITPGSTAIPTFSEWGLILLAIALLGVATVYIMRRRGLPA